MLYRLHVYQNTENTQTNRFQICLRHGMASWVFCHVTLVTFDNYLSILDLMKSKLILLNMVISAMFIFQSISTLVNREDSPTLSKTYLSGPDYYTTYFVSGPPGLSQDHLQDHIRNLRTTNVF